MSFKSVRPHIEKNLSRWEIEHILKYVPELKNPCIDEWTISSLPKELNWLLLPDIKQLELIDQEYVIFWKDGHKRSLTDSEALKIENYLKNKTTFRKKTIDYRDLPRDLQKLWDVR